MNTIKFLFLCLLGKMVLMNTDSFSRALQDKSITAAEGQELAQNTMKSLEKVRDVDSFNNLWELVRKQEESL